MLEDKEQSEPNEAARYKQLVEFGVQITEILDIEELLIFLAKTAVRMTDSEAVEIFLRNRDSGAIKNRLILYHGAKVQRSSVSGTLLESVILNNRFELRNEPTTTLTGKFTKSLAYMPISHNIQVLGALCIYNPEQLSKFTSEDIIALEFLASTAGMALINIYHQGEIAQSHREIDALSRIIRLTGEAAEIKEIDTILTAWLQIATSNLGFDYAALSLIDRGNWKINTLQGISVLDKIDMAWVGQSSYQLTDTDILVDVIMTSEIVRLSGWDPRLNQEIYDEYNHKDLVRVYLPIIDDHQHIIGVAETGYHKTTKAEISDRDIKHAGATLDFTASIIRNWLITHNIHGTLTETLKQSVSRTTQTDNRFGLVPDQKQLEEILSHISDSATKALGIDLVEIYSYTERTEYLRLPPYRFGKMISSHRPEQTSDDDAVSYIIDKRSAVYMTSVHKHTWLSRSFSTQESNRTEERYIDREKIISMASLPLILDGHYLGFVFFNFRTAQKFRESTISFLEFFAEQISTALFIDSLAEQIDTYTSSIEFLGSFGLESARQDIDFNLEDTLSRIYANFKTLMKYENFYISLYDDESNQISFPFVIHKNVAEPENLEDYDTRPFGNGLTEHVIRTRMPIRLPLADLDIDEWFADNLDIIPKGEMAQSWVGAPMILADDRVLGVIVTQSFEHKNLFTNTDVSILKTMASQAAIALENMRIMSSAKDRLDRLEVLKSAANSMVSNIRQPKHVFQSLADATRELLSANSVVVLPLSDSGYFETRWVTTSPIEMSVNYEPSQPRESGVTRNIFKEGIVEVYDTSVERENPLLSYINFLEESDIRSYVGVRMAFDGENVGIIFVNFNQKRVLSNEEKSALLSISALASATYFNSRSLDNEKKWSEDIEKLVGLGRTPSSVFDLSMSLNNTLARIIEIVPCDECTIWLIDHDESSSFTPFTAVVNSGHFGMQNLAYEEKIVKHIAETNTPYLSQELGSDHESGRISGTPEQEQNTYLAVPLLFEEEFLGVISLSRTGFGKFNVARDLPMMELVAVQAGASIKLGGLLRALEYDRDILTVEIDGSFTKRGDRIAGHIFYITIAHDMGNLLQIISGQLVALEDNAKIKKSLSKNNRERFDTTIARIETTQEAILDFLDFAKTESSEKEVISLHKLIERASRLIGPRLVDKMINLHMIFNAANDNIYVNSFQMVEVLINLITNSIKAEEMVPANRKQIKIITFDQGRHIEVRVEDQGTGIKNEDENKIFDKYYSYWPEGSKGTGSGLGLSICKRIVEEHGGSLAFNSNYGKGTTFTISLPTR